jgi:peptide chain release factor 1
MPASFSPFVSSLFCEIIQVVSTYRQFKDCEKQIEETKVLQKENEDDPDMAEMIDSEMESLSNQLEELEEKLKVCVK